MKWDKLLEMKTVDDSQYIVKNKDIVLVVRCKDCQHYWKNNPSDDVSVCLASPKDDAFCSEGEKERK